MRKALEYRKQGYNYREIAVEMRISLSTAHTYVAEALKEITREPAEEVLALHLERYDELLYAVWSNAINGDYFAIDKVMQIMARIERLHGVESPREKDATSETANMLDQLLANSLKQLAGTEFDPTNTAEDEA